MMYMARSLLRLLRLITVKTLELVLAIAGAMIIALVFFYAVYVLLLARGII